MIASSSWIVSAIPHLQLDRRLSVDDNGWRRRVRELYLGLAITDMFFNPGIRDWRISNLGIRISQRDYEICRYSKRVQKNRDFIAPALLTLFSAHETVVLKTFMKEFRQNQAYL